jgi:hypothetical protein
MALAKTFDMLDFFVAVTVNSLLDFFGRAQFYIYLFSNMKSGTLLIFPNLLSTYGTVRDFNTISLDVHVINQFLCYSLKSLF